MKLEHLQYIPENFLPTGASLNRIQGNRAGGDAVRIGALRLAPPGLLKGRFDLSDVSTGYFAETPDTAVYEALARREVTSLSLSLLAGQRLLTAVTRRPLHLLDLRPLASSWPVLESLRFHETQELAADAHQHGYEGIVYLSAQQHGMDCFAVFGQALEALKVLNSVPLLDDAGRLHRAAFSAIRGACIPVTP